MSPKVLKSDNLIFWFHSYDALHENRASVHVGKGSQDDHNDAKVWLEPKVEVMRAGKTLRNSRTDQGFEDHRTGFGIPVGGMAWLQT